MGKDDIDRTVGSHLQPFNVLEATFETKGTEKTFFWFFFCDNAI